MGTAYRFGYEIFRVRDWQRDNGFEVTAGPNEWEYGVYLMDAKGIVLDAWDSVSGSFQTGGIHLTFRQAQKAVREIKEDVEAGDWGAWFVLGKQRRGG